MQQCTLPSSNEILPFYNTETSYMPGASCADTVHLLHTEFSTPFDQLSSNRSQICDSVLDFINIDSDESVSSLILNDKDTVDNTKKLKTSLREWACDDNIKSTSLNKLLRILQPYFTSLPNDYRLLLETPRSAPVINLNNGQMFYLGIQNQLLIRLAAGLKNGVKKILLQINIDGLPLFKSSSIELYPILALS